MASRQQRISLTLLGTWLKKKSAVIKFISFNIIFAGVGALVVRKYKQTTKKAVLFLFICIKNYF
jgi:hypothetical protein|nr:MAG TPA: hypothetical protein [Caudoviricetes sp.]